MADVIASGGATVILMHMQGTPETMQKAPHYEDVVGEVKAFLEERLAYAVSRGIPENRIILDPGIGFGKTLDHNMRLLKNLRQICAIGRPVCVGVSRKSFLGRLASPNNPLPVEQRLEGSLAAGCWAAVQGAQGLRVHDVQAHRRALAVWKAFQDTPS